MSALEDGCYCIKKLIYYLLQSLSEVFVVGFCLSLFQNRNTRATQSQFFRNFQSVSWNTLWSIEKKYSVNHDRIIIRSGNSSCRDNFVITCPFAQDAISSMHGQNHCGILHYSFTFSQRLTEHKARARFERSWKVPNEFGWWHF